MALQHSNSQPQFYITPGCFHLSQEGAVEFPKQNKFQLAFIWTLNMDCAGSTLQECRRMTDVKKLSHHGAPVPKHPATPSLTRWVSLGSKRLYVSSRHGRLLNYGEETAHSYQTSAFHRDCFMGSAGRTLTLPGPDGPSSAPVQPGSPLFFLGSVMFCTVLGSCCRNNLWFVKIINWALLSRLLPGSIHKIYHSHASASGHWLILEASRCFAGQAGSLRVMQGKEQWGSVI